MHTSGNRDRAGQDQSAHIVAHRAVVDSVGKAVHIAVDMVALVVAIAGPDRRVLQGDRGDPGQDG